MILRLVVALAFAALAAARTVMVAEAAPPIQLDTVVTGLTAPVHLTNARDGSNRLFIVEQAGIIKVLQPGSTTPTEFLNIVSKVLSGGERGLLGLAFHPDLGPQRRFFVYYTRKPEGDIVIARYQVSLADVNVADTAETVVLTIPHSQFGNHNGGMLAFGPDDGFLYIGTGDGGSGNDPNDRGQNINDLLGKILRIDVDVPANSPIQYASPTDNPFSGIDGADEVYAWGFRNPWRFAFDRGGTHQLYVGDVGQNSREEIDIVVKGGNYGWRVYEGTICTPFASLPNGVDPRCNVLDALPPIVDYSHSGGRCSVTGGYVYRGSLGNLPVGSYVYADYCSGEIWVYENGTPSSTPLLDSSANIASFGEDEAGEIYVVGIGGTIYHIAKAGVAVTSVTPGQGAQGATVPVTVNGTGFAAGSTLGFGTGITVSNLVRVSSVQLTATLTIAAAATVGARTVTVTSPGVGTATLPSGFSVVSTGATLTLAYVGKQRDVVGQSNTALAADGAMDGTLTVTLTAGGPRTVTALRLDSDAPGTWDTLNSNVFWVLGVASTQNGALLNATGTMAVSFAVSTGGSFFIFASDYQNIEFATGRRLTVIATFSDGSTATASTTVAPPTPPPGAPTLTLAYLGKQRDVVGQGNTALAADGAMDGTLSVTMTAGGPRTVTALRLDSDAPGTWDTLNSNGFWALAAATTQGGALLNAAGTMAVNFAVSTGGSFFIFASDYQNIEFATGRRLTLTATFSDGTTATASTTVASTGPPGSPTLTLAYQGKQRDAVGQGNTALAADGALDGTFTVTLTAGGPRTVTALRLDCDAPGVWDTLNSNGFWVLGVAGTQGGALLNQAGTMAVNFALSTGQSFSIFASDYQNREFASGRRLTLTVTFSDASTATAAVTIP